MRRVRTPRRMLAIVAAVSVVILAAAAAFLELGAESEPPDGAAPVWTETAWPFAVDPFGRGKAFRCSRAACGTEVRLYVRPKLGLCNCTTGVATDDDLDRMGDLYLVSQTATPLLPGHRVTVGPMDGRGRVYALASSHAAGKTAISIAVRERCDMVVATAVLQRDDAEALEPHIIAFLNSAPTMRWIEVALGL